MADRHQIWPVRHGREADPVPAGAMQRLIALKDRFDVAWACDADHDRHGIVARSAGSFVVSAMYALTAFAVTDPEEGMKSRRRCLSAASGSGGGVELCAAMSESIALCAGASGSLK